LHSWNSSILYLPVIVVCRDTQILGARSPWWPYHV